MTPPPIALPLVLGFPTVTAFGIWNVVVSMACTCVLAGLVLRRPTYMARFAVILAGGLNVLFQWPLALYSAPVEQSLADPFFFSLCAHLTVAALLLWVALTPQLRWSGCENSEVRPAQIIPPAAVLFGLLGIFLLLMPAQCTALFAMLFDPSATLLAREVTIKLAGSTIATSSYGAVANAAAPATAGIALLLMIQSLRRIRVVIVVACLALIAVSFASVLIGGSKGLLIPFAIVLLFAAAGTYRSLMVKVVAVVISTLFLAGLLASFELLRERGGRDVPYDFAGCMTKLGNVSEGRELLQSMANGGLTMTPDQIGSLMSQLESAGNVKLPPVSMPEAKAPTADRAATYLNAFAYRSFVTPIQGAAWHHLYVEEFGSPGIGTLPLALKILGYSTDATTLVYEKYGVIYSGGDATKGSTTPTSYVFAYPAYFGWVGLFAVILLTIGVDLVGALLMRRADRATLSIGAGLLAVIAYTASTSDLYTAMASHGGAIGLLLVAVMSWRGKEVQTSKCST